MKAALDDSIDVAHIMGGMIEFTEKGTYHNSLTISSHKYGKTWRKKIKGNSCNGALNASRRAVYNYNFCDGIFKIQAIENEKPVSDWIEIPITEVLQD